MVEPDPDVTSEPECRALRDNEIQPDGLPDVSLYGPLEVEFTSGPVNGIGAPHWLARYSKLPGYLGVGRLPAEAVASLELAFAESPVLRVTITRYSSKALRSFAERLKKGVSAGLEIRRGKRHGDNATQAATDNGIRKSDALRFANGFAERSKSLAGEDRPYGDEAIELASYLATRKGIEADKIESGVAAEASDDIEALIAFFEDRHHTWELEWHYARRKMPMGHSGIYA